MFGRPHAEISQADPPAAKGLAKGLAITLRHEDLGKEVASFCPGKSQNPLWVWLWAVPKLNPCHVPEH